MGNEISSLAWLILDLLGQQEGAEDLEIGGGLALWHYSPHRSTHDIDAWWLRESEAARQAIQRTMEAVAAEQGLQLVQRQQPGYESWDLKREGKAVFAFQVARKSSRVEPPADSRWGRLKMESLRENLASKMNALVQRGAPRDILDVATVLKSGLVDASECWQLWRQRRPDLPYLLARANVLKYLNALEARKPLSSFADPVEREQAERNRSLIRALAELELE